MAILWRTTQPMTRAHSNLIPWITTDYKNSADQDYKEFPDIPRIPGLLRIIIRHLQDYQGVTGPSTNDNIRIINRKLNVSRSQQLLKIVP
jgi:hypothetical protein